MDFHIDLESENLSALSFEALDDLLLNASILVESEDALLEFILSLQPSYQFLLRHIKIGFLSEDGFSLLLEQFWIPPETEWMDTSERIAHPPPQPRSIDARMISESPDIFAVTILSGFPAIFSEFRRKRLSLLWRGSRDGFGASQFHSRCDGRPNTLTVILDADGNVFGGFTPVEWESRVWNGKSRDKSNLPKADYTLKSFIFTLRNPHNFPAKRFALNPERKREAIFSSAKHGPCFGGGCDIAVTDNCNTNTKNFTCRFGHSYINDSGRDGITLFTGAKNFQVKEIEVFEITD
jgi:hypothetical protein